MFNYQRRIVLSTLLVSLGTICLFIGFYEWRQTVNNYNFICLLGSISEQSPDELEMFLNTIESNAPSEELYEQGISALKDIGYGTNGRTYLEHYFTSITPFVLCCGGILLLLFLWLYLILHPISQMKQIIHTIIGDIEHAMNKYPVNFKTSNTNIMLLDRMTDMISKLTKQLNQQISLLKKAQEDRTVFIENISHQIKTPLTCISLDLELLENLSDTNRISVYTASCYTQINHIEALVNRLLKIGKLEAGKIHYEFLEHNLLDTFSVLCNTLEGQFPNKKFNIFYDHSSDYILHYDIIWLYEAFENILKNCCLYSYDDEGIEIHLTHYDSYIKVILCDHGIGIPQEDLPNIFDRFYRSQQNHSQEGFGIGLNLAKLVIEGHHGMIFAHSDNRSTQFIIHLPLII